jgi:hypothetical protein
MSEIAVGILVFGLFMCVVAVCGTWERIAKMRGPR